VYTKILVATDGSENAAAALRAAAAIAQKFGSRVEALSVFSVPVAVAPVVGAPGVTFDAASLVAIAEEVQNSVASRTADTMQSLGLEPIVRSETGHPAETICRIADEEKFDLIVIGSRGLSEWKSFLLGSVSDRVAHHAHCSVLIVK
jgi:nucleotide-binding universal stress UspA family protein